MNDSPEPEQSLESLQAAGAIVRLGKSGAVLSLDFRAMKSDEQIANWSFLLNYPKLRELFLDQCSFSDDAMDYVAKLDRLQTISLKETLVTEQGIAKLSTLPKLTLLHISPGQVSEQFLSELRKRMIATRIVVQ